MPRLALRLASTVAAVAAVGAVSATPAFADPCTSGERVTGRNEVGWICTNIDTGATRIVPYKI